MLGRKLIGRLVSLFAICVLVLQLCSQSSNAYGQNSEDRHQGVVNEPTYLSLVLRVHADGSICVVRANEVSGKLILPPQLDGGVLYVVVKEHKMIATGSLPEDPLIQRGFGSGTSGEKVEEKSSATVLVSIPETTLREAETGKLSIRFYMLKSGVRVTADNPEVLDKLVSEKKAMMRFELSGNEFASQLKRLNQR